MKVLIIEDDISTALDYELLLRGIGHFDIEVIDNWKDARNSIKSTTPDFAIVDLFLSEENSANHFHSLSDSYIPYIVCTGKPGDNSMNEALSQNAAAYLVKPVSSEALEYTIRKLLKDINSKKTRDEFLLFKENRNIHRVPIGSLHFLEVEGNYVTLHLESSKKIILKKSMKKILGALSPDHFTRINRSSIVNTSQIKSIEKNKITLKNDMKFTLGKTYKSEVINKFQQEYN